VFTAGFADLVMILGMGLASLATESMTISRMRAQPARWARWGSF
jgi:hypothetical protein